MKLAVFDLDNTLLNNRKEISGYTADILKELRKRGILIAFATARPERATKRFQKAARPDFIIANNGATLMAGEKCLYQNNIPDTVVNSLTARLLRQPAVTCLTAEAGHYLYTTYTGEEWEEGWNPVFTDFQRLLLANIPKLSTECRTPAVLEPILAQYGSLHLYQNTGESWQQILCDSSTKMNAIKILAGHCGIEAADVTAFGDDYNDVEMIKGCGRGVAVGNAVFEVKAAADCVCDSNDNDGPAKWIEQYLRSL